MHGQEKIILARLNGQTPSFVFVNDYPCKTDWFEHADHATVCTHNAELSRMDLRFLVGLRVSISATSEDRALPSALIQVHQRSRDKLPAVLEPGTVFQG